MHYLQDQFRITTLSMIRIEDLEAIFVVAGSGWRKALFNETGIAEARRDIGSWR